MTETAKPQEGTWTLTAPDGRTWQAENPLKTVAKEQRERVPAYIATQRILSALKEIPTVVCLCGSTRFWREFQRASLRETMAGKIVLSIGAATGTDDEHFGNLPQDEYDRIKADLDELHLRKIDLADEVLILNVHGYIGESTLNELNYAKQTGKKIRYLE